MAVSDWTTDFENVPENTEAVSQGADRIRTFKDLTREIIAVDHYLVPADASANTGQHNKVTLRAQDPAPTATSTNGILYSFVIDGETELFYDNADSAAVQITKGGARVADSIPVDSKMYFYENAAPDGWSFSDSLNDRLLYSTSTASEGGNDLGTSHASVDNVSWTISGISVDDHALTQTEAPRHAHWSLRVTSLLPASTVVPGVPAGRVWGAYQGKEGASVRTPEYDYITRSHGGNFSNDRTEDAVTNPQTESDGVAHPHALTIGDGWRPLCSVVILCTKDAYT